MIEIERRTLAGDGRARRNHISERVLRSHAGPERRVREAGDGGGAARERFRGEQGERYELRPEDLLAADKARSRAGTRSDRHLPFASGLRRLFLRDRFEEFLPVVFVCRAVDSKAGKFDHANSFLPDLDQTEADKEELNMAKILIPTALRQFTGQQDSVEVSGGTVGEVLNALTEQVSRSAQESVQR